VLDKNRMERYFGNIRYDSRIEVPNGRNYTITAIDLYNQNNYEASIDNLILARKANRYEYGLVYYYLGLCLMDINSLELAKKSFEHSIDYFFNRRMHEGINFGIEDLFSYDNNHVKREPYFAYL
jgi:tetratricopeptide (TPR) repeat protein